MERMNLISHPDAKFSEEKIYHFKTTFHAAKPQVFTADIFADARYKLYLNGNLVSIGPCKGNESDLYYNSIEIRKHLKDGENVLEAVVLQLKNEYDCDNVFANLCSVLRTGNLRFAMQGIVATETGNISVETDESWLVAEVKGILFEKDENNTVGLNELIEKEYHTSLKWVNATAEGHCVHYEASKNNPTQRGRYSLKPAPIPNQTLDEIALRFDNGICDAGRYVTSYLKFVFSGKGIIKLTYAECKTIPAEIRKGDRIDRNGLIEGYCDVVEIDGDKVEYEPFWYRAFRFIKAEITGDIKIESVCGWKTTYPLEVIGSFNCDSDIDNELWKISLRTLKCCMHETYEDCPYYEQEQYLMDSRLEALYMYNVSNDDRMVRRLLGDFASNQFSDGMLRSRTPDILPQIIPSFSLYYIFMLYEHYERFADIDLVKSYYPVALGVLRYFSEHLSEKGLVKRSAFWDFVDWTHDWTNTREVGRGSPLAEGNEEITIYTLMYIAATRKMALLTKKLGNKDDAENLSKQAEKVTESVKKHCFDNEKMLFADGPSKKYFSAHAQLWAVLSECVDKETAGIIMKNSFALSTQPTYCYIYDYFRALEKSGLYDERKVMMDALRSLIPLHCTTVPEKPVNPRSECHAWNAVVLYEFAASDLGIRIKEDEKTIYIKPYIKDFTLAKGKVAMKNGVTEVEWKKENGVFTITVQSPSDYTKNITLPDGSLHMIEDNNIKLICNI